MNRKNKIKAIVAFAVAAALLVPGSAVFANNLQPPDTIVSVRPVTQTVEKGEAFDVEVYIEPAEPVPVCAAEIFKVYYDKDVITATGVTYEGFFDPYDTMKMTPDISVPGVISGIAEFTMATETVTASNVFCTISFTADNLGTSAIDLEEVKVFRPGPSEVPITVNDGEVTVTQFYTLDISVVGNGTTDPAEGTHSYMSGTTVNLEATPDLGWSFGHWDGDVANPSSAITNITMDANKTVTANFTENHYILTVSTVGSGHVDVDPDKEFYFYGEEPQLTAVADSGWTFDSWSGDLSGNPTTIFMDGNKNVTATFTDTIPPNTEIILDGTMGDNGWYVSVVTVTLVATDEGSGVESTWYRLDSGDWNIYINIPFEVCEEGNHTVEYNSTDNAGNTESTNVSSFKIDKTAPETSCELDPSEPDGENDWCVSDVEVTLTATDDSSGVEFTYCKLDNGEYEEYDGPITVSEDGEYKLWYYSVDYAGNEETKKSVDFKIDKTPPTIELTWDGENSKLVADVNDETSGINRVEFSVNGKYVGEDTTAPSYEWEVTNPKKGDKGQATVYDNAGNKAVSEEIDAVSQSQSQSNSNLVPVQRRISWICLGDLTGIQNTQRRV